jgi:hypothetical protein
MAGPARGRTLRAGRLESRKLLLAQRALGRQQSVEHPRAGDVRLRRAAPFGGRIAPSGAGPRVGVFLRASQAELSSPPN